MKLLTLIVFLTISTTLFGQSRVTVNADKTISLNGAKFFPISVYVQSDWAGIVNMGVNAASRPFCVNPRAFAQSENNRLYLHYTAGSGCDAQNAQDIKNRRTSAFVNSVNQTKNSNYLFGYGLPDEPLSAMNLSAADTKWAYDVIKGADPNHPVFLTDYARDVSAYKNSADIFLNDLYPFNNVSNPLYEIKTRMINMQNQVAPKPAWLIIQTGSQFGTPTNAQIRAETYLSIALGSTGIIFYSFDVEDAGGVHNIKKDGDPVFMKNLISELKSFSPYFLGTTNTNLVYSSNDIDAILKDHEGKSYLIAVNKSATAKSISFTLAGRGNATATIKGLSAAGSSRTGQNLNISSTGVLSDNLQGLEAVVYEINSPTVALRTPENPALTVAGLDYNYYEGNWNVLPNFASLTAVKSGASTSPDLSTRNRDDQFGFSYTGYVDVPADGSYTFYTSSDDGSQLYIGSTLVVNNDGLHGVQERSGTIGLKAGKHAVRVTFFEQGGDQVLSVSYQGPNLSKRVIPASAYYRVPVTTPNVAPTVSLTAPSNNASYTAPASVAITANASDADGTVSKVEFYSGTTKIGEDLSSPYSYNWSNVTAGTYTLTARATDNSGTTTTSSSVTVTVRTPTTPNVAPSVSLTGPANNASYAAPATITLTANASDADGSITKVEFYSGTTKLGEDLSSPYSYSWTSVGAGTYSLTAKATDNSGATTTSSSVSVTVRPATTNTCSGIAQYVENNGYVAGSKVKNGSNSYECKPWPYSGWCNGAAWAYGPGTGAYWTDAWTLSGSCTSSRLSATENDAMLSSSPNPFSASTTVELNTAEGGNVSLKVYDKTGHEVAVLVDGYLPAGLHQFQWNSSQWAPDVYVLRYQNNDQLITRKIVKAQ